MWSDSSDSGLCHWWARDDMSTNLEAQVVFTASSICDEFPTFRRPCLPPRSSWYSCWWRQNHSHKRSKLIWSWQDWWHKKISLHSTALKASKSCSVSRVPYNTGNFWLPEHVLAAQGQSSTKIVIWIGRQPAVRPFVLSVHTSGGIGLESWLVYRLYSQPFAPLSSVHPKQYRSNVMKYPTPH
jgi:hypothetical protein